MSVGDATGAPGLGTVGQWLGQLNPNDVLKDSLTAWGSQGLSQEGKLVQNKSISGGAYTTLTIAREAFGVVNGFIDLKKQSTQAKREVQALHMEITKMALMQHHEIQKGVLLAKNAHTVILKEITSEQAKVAQFIKEFAADNARALLEAARMDDKEIKLLVIQTLKEQYPMTLASLEKVVDAQLQVAKLGAVDDSFFREAAAQAGAILGQVTNLALMFAEKDEQELKTIIAASKETTKTMLEQQQQLLTHQGGEGAGPSGVVGTSQPAGLLSGPGQPSTSSQP